MKVIDIKNLEKIYNESEVNVNAIRGIDLSFEKGEFAAVVGPSGSGKTKPKEFLPIKMLWGSQLLPISDSM